MAVNEWSAQDTVTWSHTFGLITCLFHESAPEKEENWDLRLVDTAWQAHHLPMVLSQNRHISGNQASVASGRQVCPSN